MSLQKIKFYMKSIYWKEMDTKYREKLVDSMKSKNDAYIPRICDFIKH